MKIAASAGIYITASMVIEFIRTRKDPRPWVEKKKDLAIHALSAGVLGAGIGAIGYSASAGVNHLIGEFSVQDLEAFFA